MIRRSIDVCAATLVLLVLSPLFLILALAVIIDSPGSPFHRGQRVGRDGRIFRMWKFRTMVPGAAAAGPAVTGRNDPRVTRVGRILRRTKLDELPQFLNVLAGDMTLVGPRPEAPEIVSRYSKEQRQVLAVTPGITGWGQLHAGDEEDRIPESVSVDDFYVAYILPEKVDRDMRYLQTRTASGDLKIVLATVTFCLRAICRR